MKKIKMLIAGLFLIFVDVPIATALEYSVYHIKNESSIRSFLVNVFNVFMGKHYYIDVLPDFLGYILIIIALAGMRKYHKRFNIAEVAAVVGLAGSLIMLFITFIPMDVKNILTVIGIIKAADYFCIIMMVFYIGRGLYAQVDGYMYLEMWKDIKASWDIMVMAPPVIYILGIVSVVDFPGVKQLAMIFYGVWLYAAILYLYNVYYYGKKLKLFEEQ